MTNKDTRKDGIHDMTCKECGAWFDALEGEQHSCPECGSADVYDRAEGDE